MFLQKLAETFVMFLQKLAETFVIFLQKWAETFVIFLQQLIFHWNSGSSDVRGQLNFLQYQR